MKRILILNGPNLDLLGLREPAVYGSTTLADVTASLDLLATELGVELDHHQTPHEGELVEHIHRAWREGFSGALVNAGAYTHTSIAVRDAFLATALPFVEVHVSNIHARETFRHKSLLADISVGFLCGFGTVGYELGLRGLVARIGR